MLNLNIAVGINGLFTLLNETFKRDFQLIYPVYYIALFKRLKQINIKKNNLFEGLLY